jgi:hypothetical protein
MSNQWNLEETFKDNEILPTGHFLNEAILELPDIVLEYVGDKIPFVTKRLKTQGAAKSLYMLPVFPKAQLGHEKKKWATIPCSDGSLFKCVRVERRRSGAKGRALPDLYYAAHVTHDYMTALNLSDFQVKFRFSNMTYNNLTHGSFNDQIMKVFGPANNHAMTEVKAWFQSSDEPVW